MTLANSVGVVDSGYRDEVRARFKMANKYVQISPNEYVNEAVIYKEGDRVCQLIIIPIPNIELIQADTLDSSQDRGGGFGSTGQ